MKGMHVLRLNVCDLKKLYVGETRSHKRIMRLIRLNKSYMRLIGYSVKHIEMEEEGVVKTITSYDLELIPMDHNICLSVEELLCVQLRATGGMDAMCTKWLEPKQDTEEECGWNEK